MSKAWAENMVDEFARTCVGVIVVTLLVVKFWVL